MSQISLPTELWILILERTDSKSLMKCYQVNKTWKDICNRFIKKSFSPVLFCYWKWNVSRVSIIVNKYFPKHQTPSWVLKYAISEEKFDPYRIGRLKHLPPPKILQ